MPAIVASEDAVCLEEVQFSWPESRFSIAVNGFRVAAGEKLLLLGESGSGKSTLLSLICAIATPQQGRIRVAGQDLGALSPAQRDRFRADKTGIIFQMFNLLPYASALENILLPLRFSALRRKRCHDPRTEALSLCAGLGLPEDLLTGVAASTLSVGQQQRVAVARALIGAPDIIIADEPTSALDAGSQAEFLDLLFRQLATTGSTLIMVSHDARLADRFDRVVRLEDIAEIRRKAVA